MNYPHAVFDRSNCQLARLPLAVVRCSPFNTRHVRTPAMVDRIAESLRTHHQKSPITVYPGSGANADLYFVIGGETRRLAALLLGWNEIDAIIDLSINPTDIASLSIYSTLLNRGHQESDLDRAFSALKLSDSGLSLSAIASALMLDSKTTVQRYLKMVSLPPELLNLGRQSPERFSHSLASVVHDGMAQHGEDFALALLKQGLDGQTHRQLLDCIKTGVLSETNSTDNKTAAKRKRRQAHLELQLSGVKTGHYDLFHSTIPGRKAVRLNMEADAAVIDQFHSEFQDWLTAFQLRQKA